MKRIRAQSGFTLVEITLVMAVTALLIVGFITGQGALRRNTAFTTAVDQVKNQLTTLQNEANQSVSYRSDTTNAGKTSGTNWGTLVEFDATVQPETMKSWTLVQDENNQTGQLFKCDQQDRKLAQGMVYKPSAGGSSASKQAVIFRRSPAGVFVVNDFTEVAGGGSSLCSQVALGPLAGGGGAAGGGGSAPTGTGGYTCPDGQLQDGLGGCVTPLPPTGNCNDVGFTCGLYGEYFDNLWTSRISAFTDPGIGNMGTNFSYAPSNANGQNQFTPLLRRRTANQDVSTTAVRWTGQIKINDTAAHNYCSTADDGQVVTINGTTINMVANGEPFTACGSYAAPAIGWYKFQSYYANNQQAFCTSAGLNHCYSGEAANVRLTDNSVEIPNSRYRRSMDWSVAGSAGVCGATAVGSWTDACRNENAAGAVNYVVGAYGANASCVLYAIFSCSNASTSPEGKVTMGQGDYASCAAVPANSIMSFSYSASGITPSNNYKMDLTYHNWRGDQLNGPPAGYAYKVCVQVNGVWMNSGNPYNLQVWDPKNTTAVLGTHYPADFTATIPGIQIPTGSATIRFVWLNDSYSAGDGVVAIGGLNYSAYDANFAIKQVSLYRDIDSTGRLITAAPPTLPTATLPKPSNISRALAWLVPGAGAAGSTDVLNPANYDGTNANFMTTQKLYFQIPGDASQTGYLRVDPTSRTIDRGVQ